MTHTAAGRGHRFPRIWLLPAAMLTTITGATYFGFFSRAMILDLVAWWPAWLLIGLLVGLARGRRIGRVRVSGIVPLIAAATLGLFVYAHLAGWAVMPSTSNNLVGPQAAVGSSTALSARVDGELFVSSGSDHLYRVSATRRGGDVGMAEAVEQSQGDSMSVVLREQGNPGFYEFSGWVLELSNSPRWSLTLDGVIDSDLKGLTLDSAQLGGSGVVELGGAATSTPITVNGVFEISIPSGVVARVIGPATVPDDWEQSSDGARSPTPGEGWVISVAAGSSLTITGG